MPPGEAPSPVSSEAQAKPALGDILKQAKEAGRETTQAVRAKESSFFSGLRERGKQAWSKAKEAGGKIRDVMDIAIGVTYSLDVQDALANYAKDKVVDAKDSLVQKGKDIHEAAINKKDQAVNGLKERVTALFKKANESLVQPQIKRAVEIGNTIKQNWADEKTQAKQAVEGAVSDVKQKWVDAKAESRQQAENVKSFFSTQAENARDGIRANSADVVAKWHDVLAKPSELKAQIAGGLAEKLAGMANTNMEAAQARRVKAEDHRIGARIIRMSGEIRAAAAPAPAA